MRQQETTSDEPLTPGACLFLVPEFNQTIICAIGLRDLVSQESIEIMRSNLANSLITKHPRFNSLFVEGDMVHIDICGGIHSEEPGSKGQEDCEQCGDGLEMWSNKIATAKFLLDDMKIAKGGVPNSTINDVVFGIVSSGLSRYLEVRSAQDMQEGQQITGLAMANLRESKRLQEMPKPMEEGGTARWGNEFGFVLLPIHYHRTRPGEDPLEHVRRAKVLSDRKKLSLEAYFTYNTCDFLTRLLWPRGSRDVHVKLQWSALHPKTSSEIQSF
ncbi:Wax ester synthase/diacylglycerol acyltransferase 2-like protein [Drosera capensis]